MYSLLHSFRPVQVHRPFSTTPPTFSTLTIEEGNGTTITEKGGFGGCDSLRPLPPPSIHFQACCFIDEGSLVVYSRRESQWMKIQSFGSTFSLGVVLLLPVTLISSCSFVFTSSDFTSSPLLL
eukprot:RCo019907